MNWKIFMLVGMLLLASIIPIFYKTYFLDLDLIPKLKKDVWEIEFSARINPDPETKNYKFAVPNGDDRVNIIETHFKNKNLNLMIKKSTEGTLAYLQGIENRPTEVNYRLLVKSYPKKFKLPNKEYRKVYPSGVSQFLEKIELTPQAEELILKLEEDLASSQYDNIKTVKNIFYFVNEEILNSNIYHGIANSIINSRGSSRDKANLITILLRRQGIPARTMRGIKLIDREETKRSYVFWNEVYLDKKWIPMFPRRGFFAEIPAAYIPLYTSVGIGPTHYDQNMKLSIYAKRLLANQFSTLDYKRELSNKGATFLNFSPYMLPLKSQGGIKLLLLFSVGCVALAFCRNIVGVKTFGIFFPILLSLFYKETSLGFGIGVFIFIMLLGYLERFFLKKLHLLAVPRLSIILTLLVITILAFSILNNYYNFSEHNPTILPIIITTMFIERFSIMMEEEGSKNTFYSLTGTLFVSFISYGLFSWKTLEFFIYANPEFLFSIIAILILIGKYTGYRFSEIIRFREFLKK